MIKKAFISVLNTLGVGKNSYVCGYHTIQDNLQQLLGYKFNIDELAKESNDVCRILKISDNDFIEKPFYLIFYIDGRSVSRVEYADTI